MISARQEQILQGLVASYIQEAQPISSQHLQESYGFALSCATIRNELAELTELGYAVQPHTSAGRVPTDKGYRFMVDHVLKERAEVAKPAELLSHFQGPDTASLLSKMARGLSDSSSLVTAVSFKNLFWKEGWESLFLQPEFSSREVLLSFTKFVDDAEGYLPFLRASSSLVISIGGEVGFSNVKDFSILVAVHEHGKERLIVALLGPRRMAYQKNIELLSSLKAMV